MQTKHPLSAIVSTSTALSFACFGALCLLFNCVKVQGFVVCVWTPNAWGVYGGFVVRIGVFFGEDWGALGDQPGVFLVKMGGGG